MPHHSPHQKGIIKRYYEHRDTLALQKLGEVVSNLYLETNKAKIGRAWRSAHSQMLALGIAKERADFIVEDRDLGALAEVVSRLQ